MTVKNILQQVDRLSVREQLELLESLSRALRQRMPVDEMEWHTALDATYGILADDPIERPEQLPFEEREELL